MVPQDLPSDNVYAFALAKTLTRVTPPVTVGLYSLCPIRIRMVLKRIKVHMEREALRRQQKTVRESSKPRSAHVSGVNLIALVSRLLFYRPVFTEENQRQKNIRYIFVSFSAWHFAGSDVLWAGLVLRLYEAFWENFGRILLSLYRVTQYTEVSRKTKHIVQDTEDWKSKKVCGVPLWLLIFLALLGALVIIPFLVMFVDGDHFGTIDSLALAILGVPAAGAARFLVLVGKNVVFSQDVKMKSMMDNEKVSSQLGFMNEVRKEVEILCDFIHFMEVFERRKIRLVMEIKNLDRCTPNKIVGVLDAINILLSDEESPFISVLAVNPEVLAKQINYADCCLSTEDKSYEMLNRIITLSFTVPPLCRTSKRKLFQSLTCGRVEIPEQEHYQEKLGTSDVLAVGDNGERGILFPEMQHRDEFDDLYQAKKEEMKSRIEAAFACIYAQEKFHEYMGNTISMRRVINSIRASVIILVLTNAKLPSEEHIAAWVVLANQWPCRLSWILQCVEDDLQRAQIESDTIETSKTLWDIFDDSRVELHMVREKAEWLLRQDGDPELFEMFLKNHFKFTIEDVFKFQQATVNFNLCMKRELARLRSWSSLKNTISRWTLAPLPVKCVVHMTTEDICKEMEKLKLAEVYCTAVRENGLNGQTLVYADNAEIRKVLQMSLGEWTAFSIHFLGVEPPLPACMNGTQDRSFPAMRNHSCATLHNP